MKKIALITGASKGIGKSLAEEFAKNKYSLILIARTKSELENLQEQLLKKYKCNSKILALDLADPESTNTILLTFKNELQNIEILINNAGFGISKKFSDMLDKDVKDMMAVNIQTLTNLTYSILPYMIKNKKGKILNVSSIAAYSPGPFMAMYYASKAYVSSFSEALNEEYKNDGVLVSALCPGITQSFFHQRAGRNKMTSGYFPIMSSESVAQIAYKKLMKNQKVIVSGYLNRVLVCLMKITPNFILSKIIAKINI
ncbi:SDR family oxidoreductase [Gammaproteobacteria bacterium]|nr:SDR family oxidoreductase [Gammaproteobacteria bacterium]